MELTDDPLIGLLKAWRAEINSVPFAYEADCDKLVRALLANRRRRTAVLIDSNATKSERRDIGPPAP
jgi:hypothetical protein